MVATYPIRDNDMLDDVCWHYYGCQSAAVEPILAERGPL